MIQGQSIWYRIGDKDILKNVDVHLPSGKLVAVLGANGAGKTTLLRALSGELSVQSDFIRINGEDIHQLSSRQLALWRGVLSQNIDVSFDFAVWEIVLMGRFVHSHGHEQEEDYRIAELAMNHADVLHLRERAYNTLSGGEKQRVQLARVLAQIWHAANDGEHRYLFLDEPTSNLDIQHQYWVMRFIREFAEARDVGVFCVLHDINLAIAFCDEIILMKDGRILIQDEPGKVLTETFIEQAYGIPVSIQYAKEYEQPFVMPLKESTPRRSDIVYT